MPVAADEGKGIAVQVKFTDDEGHGELLVSPLTAAIAAAPNSEATGAPTISGTAQVGEALTAGTVGIADEDGLENAQFDYQWIADDTAISGATGSTYTLTDNDEAKTMKVKVSFTDDRGNQESLTGTAPLTALLENTPQTSHDGQNEFTFELRFSEEFSVSYATLRDHAFTLVGGQVTGARRMDRDSDIPNVRWQMTVRPSGNGEVVITLPVTTDCTTQGAICTDDQRMLSKRAEHTVAGPTS